MTKQEIEQDLNRIYEETLKLNWKLQVINIDSREELHRIRNCITIIQMQLRKHNNDT
jgi:hypothetical protein